MTRRHQISVRFVSSLVGNVVNLGASFVAGLLIARALGPARYGDLNFLLATFAALSPLLDMGSSSAFYTFISQKKHPRRFYGYYAAWLGLQGAILIACVLLPSESIGQRLWLGQSRSLLLLAFAASFFSNQVWRAAQQIGESARETVSVQATWIGINAAHLILIGLALSTRLLSIQAVLILIAAEYAVGVAVFFRRFDWTAAVSSEADAPSLRATSGDFARYCRPLVLAGWAGFVYNYSDRWLLQRFGGSVQQGFFSVSQQFSTVSLLGATSLVNIFWKEIAQSHAEGRTEFTRDLFLETGHRLYFAAAAMTCFLFPFSRDLIAQVLGPGYAPAWTAFAVLIFFPLHQALGQLNGSYFQATHQTRTFLAFVLGTIAVSVPLAYFVLAPRDARWPGLGLHSTGLAVKMVAVQALAINLQGWVICRRQGWRWPVAYQVFVPVVLLALGGAAFAAGSHLFPGETKTLLAARLACALTIYLAGLAALVYRLPAFAGVTHEQIGRWREKLLTPEPAA